MLFLSGYSNRVDKKGRVSVPAAFRAVLSHEGASSFYAALSVRERCLECGGPKYFSKLHAIVESMPAFSPEREAFATVVFGDITPLSMDTEGRVLLPPALMEHAKIEDEVMFVGKADTFEIWAPKNYQAYRDQARSAVRAQLGQGGRK